MSANDEEKVEPMPCAFCPSPTHPLVMVSWIDGTRHSFVECVCGCRARGPVKKDRAEAISAWNAVAKAAAAKWVECEGCAFRYDAMHVLADGTQLCPVCEEHRLTSEVAALKAELAKRENVPSVVLEQMLDVARHYEDGLHDRETIESILEWDEATRLR
jgi:excinuclease UvrABC ATPase subunit